jgi:hypothetical protein
MGSSKSTIIATGEERSRGDHEKKHIYYTYRGVHIYGSFEPDPQRLRHTSTHCGSNTGREHGSDPVGSDRDR